MIENVLEVKGLAIEHYGASLSFACPKGSLTQIIGYNGTGKTLIGRQIAGLVNEGDGWIVIAGQDVASLSDFEIASKISVVPTEASLLFSRIGKTLRQEMELAFAFLGQELNEQALQDCMERFLLADLADRDPFSFSGGERVRAAIAIAVLKRPALLILDDIFDQLDPKTEKDIFSKLTELRGETGLSIIELRSRGPRYITQNESNWIFLIPDEIISGNLMDIWKTVATSNPELLPPVLSLACFLEQHLPSLKYNSMPFSAQDVINEIQALGLLPNHSNLSAKENRQKYFSVSDLLFSYKGKDSFQLGPVSASFFRGRTAVLVGKNGAGKTTMLRCLANLEKDWTGDISFEKEGLKASQPLHEWAAHVLYSFQNPDDQLFLPTVKDELLETARRTGKNKEEAKHRMEILIDRFGLSHRLNESPLNLAYPLRRIVTILSSFIAAPPVLLLDEPTAVLDLRNTSLMIETIDEYKASGGIVLLITHDYDFLSEVADDIIFIENGQIISMASHETGFDTWPVAEAPILFQLVSKLGPYNTIWSRNELLKHFRSKNSG